MNRDEILTTLKKDPDVDVLIIGGGINGAGTFLDLAINDVKVLLIDRGDFCSGAFATSSHMAHGGIRYLENGEFRLVREAVAERNRMIQNSPHMVKPLPTVIPIFKFWSGLLNAPFKFLNLLDKPSERGALVIKIGLILYDSFTGKQRTVPVHKFYSKTETLRRFPHLNKNVKFSAVYFDGQMLSPERLNTGIILEGENASPKAMAMNYASLRGIEDNYVVLENTDSKELLRIRPNLVINAAGPWIDDVNYRLGLQTRYIGGTKGSHIIVNNPVLKEAIGESEFFFENKDGRIVLLFPFFDKVIIGTSDLPIEHPDDAVCTQEEEQYFIDLVKRVFPDIPILPEQIIFRFSGVRPLEYQEAKTTGQITRDHSIREDYVSDIRILSLVGGKWTSYRAFGEQVADKILNLINKPRVNSTISMQIGGGRKYPGTLEEAEKFISNLAANNGIEHNLVAKLFERYGKLVEEILTKQGNLTVIDKDTLITENEINYICAHEKIVHLDDVLLRRSSFGWLGFLNQDNLEKISDIVGKKLGWDKTRVEEEVSRVREIFRKAHGVNI